MFITAEYGLFHWLLQMRLNQKQEVGNVGVSDLSVGRHSRGLNSKVQLLTDEVGNGIDFKNQIGAVWSNGIDWMIEQKHSNITTPIIQWRVSRLFLGVLFGFPGRVLSPPPSILHQAALEPLTSQLGFQLSSKLSMQLKLAHSAVASSSRLPKPLASAHPRPGPEPLLVQPSSRRVCGSCSTSTILWNIHTLIAVWWI
jgi:hypothetical protein